ncbi:MAG TPA: papain-like cysteine protease family protein [Stellaceae bacterium]|nr:papain-like cysteine protease family protein [Stellaceae bacterium]
MVIGRPARLAAASACHPDARFGEVCRTELAFDAFLQQAYDTQHAPQWCWAACLAMVFAFHGHRVRQERIVAEAFGGGTGPSIAGELDRVWVDDSGRRFRSRLRILFDAYAGDEVLDLSAIVAALQQNQPMILGARNHAVVLTAIDCGSTAQGQAAVGGGVFDPWPGRGPRELSADELVPMSLGGGLGFIALPEIS